MPDPFRLLPTRHLGHGFPIAEALGSSVSPVTVDLFTSAATGYILLHAIHRGLSAGGGTLLVTTFFDTLIFDGLATAIVPSFITYHVRTIIAIWFKQKFFRSPSSLTPSPDPSPPPLCFCAPKLSGDHPKSNKQRDIPTEGSANHSKQSLGDSTVPNMQNLITSLCSFMALESEEIAGVGSSSVPPSHQDSEGESPSSPSPDQGVGNRSDSGVPSAGEVRNGIETLPASAQNHRNSCSPEPWPLVVSCFARMGRKCASPSSGNSRCPSALIAQNSNDDPEVNLPSNQNPVNKTQAEHPPLIASCFRNIQQRCIMPFSTVPITPSYFSPRATLSSETNILKRQSLEPQFRSSSSEQEQEVANPSPPSPTLRSLNGPEAAVSRGQKSDTYFTSCAMPFCQNRETRYKEKQLPEHKNPPISPADKVPPLFYRFCPSFAPVDSPPPLSPQRSPPSSPCMPLNNASSSLFPSSRPLPVSSTTKAICEDAKLPVMVQTWGPVAAGMIVLSYTWQHIDRMVDELMNQTIRSVY